VPAATSPDLRTLVFGRAAVRTGLARRLREDAQLSRVELARHCGCSEIAIRKWEAGERRPSGVVGTRYLEVLEQLAAGEFENVAPLMREPGFPGLEARAKYRDGESTE
jgi:transcriptional regulator with XRE-family HTH domain